MSSSRRPTTTGGSSSSSSYSAFASVDSLVSKPVLGSDGAASWQEFRKESSSSSSAASGRGVVSTGAGPIVPVKRSDRLGTGLTTRADELRHESAVRAQSGDAPLGSGYTSFKRKTDPAEVAAKKRAKLIADRVRPDDKKYFVASATFEGWREDYVFTTRDRGTGYYWDGMDSVKKQMGKFVDGGSSSGAVEEEEGAAGEPTKPKKKKKKKKIKKSSKSTEHAEEVAEVVDTHNPMEQIAAALRRRQEAALMPPGTRAAAESAADAAALGSGHASAAMGAGASTVASAAAAASGAPQSSNAAAASSGGVSADEARRLAALGWETATDPSSQRMYYFHRGTGKRRWDSPLLLAAEGSEAEATGTSKGGEVDGGSSAAASASASAAPAVSAETKEGAASTSGGAGGGSSDGGDASKVADGEEQQPLPEGWKAARDATSGREYYYHRGTGTTQWTRPS